MRRKRIIYLSITVGLAILVLIAAILFLRPNERDRLIARAFRTLDRATAGYRPNRIERFLDSFRAPDYWHREHDRIRDELIDKGYFKTAEFTVPTSRFREVWKSLWNDSDEDKLMMYTYSPYTPDLPERTITLIGPPETVDKKLKLLERLRNDEP
jgi:hypothetical protein